MTPPYWPRAVTRLGAACLMVLAVAAPAHADYADGAKAFRADDYSAAIEEWRPLADDGYARAQFGLGVIYEEGGGGVARDLAQAVFWYEKAAGQGLADAQYNLGNLYRRGRGVEKDARTAVAWYLKAAVQNMPAAQYNLGRSYETGIGAARNYTVAAKWYGRAAKQGDIDAMLGLAGLYRYGLGLAENREAALTLYSEVARLGDSRGKFHLRAMAGEAGAPAVAAETTVAAPEPVEPTAAAPTPVPPEPLIPTAESSPSAPPAPAATTAATPIPAESEPVAETPTEADGPRYGVQLAAYRARDGAVAAWDSLRAENDDLLGGLEASFKKAYLTDGGGAVYRLVVGSYATRAEAAALCARLKQQKIDCFIPRPE